jgi:hypothetical protein
VKHRCGHKARRPKNLWNTNEIPFLTVFHLATHPAVAHAETSLIYEHRRGPGIWGAADPGAQR